MLSPVGASQNQSQKNGYERPGPVESKANKMRLLSSLAYVSRTVSNDRKICHSVSIHRSRHFTVGFPCPFSYRPILVTSCTEACSPLPTGLDA